MSDDSRIQDIVNKVRGKKFPGHDSIMLMDPNNIQDVKVTSSGILSLDIALGCGGYPHGRIVEIFGPEGCVDKDSFIQYEIKTKDGRRINSKGGTIERLWERFHGETLYGNSGGRYLTALPIGSEFYVPSVNEEDRIFHNKILDVVKIGYKECFEMRTVGGCLIIATKDHRFFNGCRYVKLKDLSIGDVILMHTSTPYTKETDDKIRCRRCYLYINNHPFAKTKVVKARISRVKKIYKSYSYKRILRSRVVVEAKMNNLSLDEYIKILNSGKNIKSMHFLGERDHVHHIDENVLNDSIENLVVFSAREHSRLHAMKLQNNLRYIATEDVIYSITPIGKRLVYDIKMESPFNNYVVNNFITHNSGKTTCTLHAISEVQRVGGAAAFVDAEHSLDISYAERLGVKVKNLIIQQPDCGEDALNVAENLCPFMKPGDIIVVDSVASLIPKAELNGEMGDQHMGLHARLMSQSMRKLNGTVSKNGVILFFTNQMRHKIGVMFGSNETTCGGDALKYYASIRIDVRRIGSIKNGDDIVGNKVRFKVSKNKVAPPYREAETEIRFGHGVPKLVDVFGIGVAIKVIESKGSWYSYGKIKLGLGAEKSMEFLKENPEVIENIERDILKSYGIGKHRTG